MNKFLRYFAGVCLVFTLAGCIGEDFDVGAPSASLAGISPVSLTEANINWSSSIGDEQQTVDDIQALGLSQDQAVMISGEDAYVVFKESEKNGGDLLSTGRDRETTAYLLKGEERIELELDTSNKFQVPNNKGNYVIVIEFKHPQGSAQYVGNVLIQ